MAMTRQALWEEIERGHIGYKVQWGRADKTDPGTAYLVLDRPIGGRGPEWNSHSEDLRNFSVLSWTSKMDAPSFSLPAGTQEVGGACPGAVAGQTTAKRDEGFVAMARLVQKRQPLLTAFGPGGGGRAEVSTLSPDWFAKAICASCYAESGNYAYSSKQLQSILLFDWTKRALSATTPSGRSVFVETMIPIVEHADYMTRGGTYAKQPVQPESPRYGKRRFFRIHDSSDFFSERYLRAWKEIADALQGIVFWAPSRIWATPWGIDAVNRVNAEPKNLIIRPSAYHINTKQMAPLGPGWVKSSTVYEGTIVEAARADDAFDWNCPAYASENARHSCRSARAPDGSRGCRACWVHPEFAVNYTFH
jgi:hypothetical protein